MKLQSNNHGFESNLPENRIAMKIKSSAKMFEILSAGIYSDKVTAVIREYICNAYDAHVSVGKQHIPFTVKLPSQLDPTFSVTDEGTGIDPNLIGEIFWTYGESSKTNDDKMIGALGLGSKSAFAYTKSSFVVKNRYQGTEYTYLCFINETGEPEGSLVGSEVSDISSGITIEFAVRPDDNYAFKHRFEKIYKYWSNVKPIILGIDVEDLDLSEPDRIIEGQDWYLENAKNKESIAIMGNVAYPISLSSIPNLPANLKIIAENPFVIKFPMGSLEFSASRESLSYTNFTCDNLIKRLTEIKDDLSNSFIDKVFTQSKDHVSFYNSFYDTFNKIKKAFKMNRDDSYHSLIDLLIHHLVIDNYVEFLGSKIHILDLEKCRFINEVDFHQSFGLYHGYMKGNYTKKFTLEHSSLIKASCNKDFQSDELLNTSNVYTIKKDSGVLKSQNWISSFVQKTKTLSSIVMSKKQDFDFFTTNSFNITGSKLSFIINDQGSSGKDKFKAFANNAKIDEQFIFVNFDKRVNTIDQVKKELSDIIEKSLSGATINYVSNIDDVREIVKSEKLSKTQIELTSITFNKSKTNISEYVGSNLSKEFRLDIKQLRYKYESNSVFDINELKNKSIVPFIIKRKGNKSLRFDNIDNNLLAVTGSPSAMNLCNHFGYFDEFIDENDTLDILSLSEKQYEKLIKKQVNLKSLSSIISKQLLDQDKIIEDTNKIVILNNIDQLSGFYRSTLFRNLIDLKIKWKNTNSYFKNLYLEYLEFMNNNNRVLHTLNFAKLEIINRIRLSNNSAIVNNSNVIEQKINDRYPMLEFIDFYNIEESDKAEKILNYIEQIDDLIESAIESTDLEIKQNSITKEEISV